MCEATQGGISCLGCTKSNGKESVHPLHSHQVAVSRLVCSCGGVLGASRGRANRPHAGHTCEAPPQPLLGTLLPTGPSWAQTCAQRPAKKRLNVRVRWPVAAEEDQACEQVGRRNKAHVPAPRIAPQPIHAENKHYLRCRSRTRSIAMVTRCPVGSACTHGLRQAHGPGSRRGLEEQYKRPSTCEKR